MGSPLLRNLSLALATIAFCVPSAWALRLIVSSAVKHDVSPAVRDLPLIARSEHENRAHPVKHWPHTPVSSPSDPVVQSNVMPAVVTSNVTSFAGVGNGDYGFSPN